MNAYLFKGYRRLVLATLVVTGLWGFATSARKDDSPEAKKYRAAYGLVLEGKWDQAGKALDDFLAQFSGNKWTDDAHFWRCYIQARKAVDKEAAFGCFETFVGMFPRSSYIKDAQAEMVTLARDLVKQGKTEYEEKVRELRQSQEKETTLMVLYALRDIGDDQAKMALVDYLNQSEDEKIRKSIVSMLGDFKDADTFDILVKTFKEDPSISVKRQALRSMSEQEDNGKALQFLKNVVVDESQPMEVRKTALGNLDEFDGVDLRPFLEKVALGSDRDLARRAVREIGDVRDTATWDSLVRIYEKSGDVDLRRTVLRTMGDDYGIQAYEILTTVATKGETRELRRTAISAMAEIEHRSTLDRLVNIVNASTDRDTREYAIRAIGRTEMPEARTLLMQLISGESDPEARVAAIRGLENLEDNGTIADLKKIALEDNNLKVRKAAIRALQHFENTEARMALIEILKANQQ